MGALAHHAALLKHDDLFRAADGGDALRDDEHSRIARLLLEGTPQRGIRAIVQR